MKGSCQHFGYLVGRVKGMDGVKGYDKLEFDVVIGNPPYQEATNNKVLEVGK